MGESRETVHCPKCGRFVSNVRGRGDDMHPLEVTATCSGHGTVDPLRFFDGEAWEWDWDDFYGEEDQQMDNPRGAR